MAIFTIICPFGSGKLLLDTEHPAPVRTIPETLVFLHMPNVASYLKPELEALFAASVFDWPETLLRVIGESEAPWEDYFGAKIGGNHGPNRKAKDGANQPAGWAVFAKSLDVLLRDMAVCHQQFRREGELWLADLTTV
jgi:hypothetical protein